MRPTRFSAPCFGVFLLLLSTSSWAQGTGSVSGTVADETGGVLPGVTVDITRGGEALTETVTDGTGRSQFDNVPAGAAELTFRLINFSTVRRNIMVAQTATLTADVQMLVATSADIVVTAPRTFRNLAEIDNPAENLVGVAAAGLNLAQFDYQNAGYVIAWKLGGTARLPTVVKRRPGRVVVEPIEAPPEVIAAGQALYAENCFRCHGLGTKSGGRLPDLRFSSQATHDQWNDIVLGGIRADRGMASFADVLDADSSRSIQAYVIAQAHREPSWLESAGQWLYEQGVCLPAAWLAD
jgi:mono/diheme cytochrome c family protein